jgi:glycosyltransferase involved in cell wall biosynthesis
VKKDEKPNLLIVSDTPLYSSALGLLVFEPTLREVEEIAPLFNEVVWLSYVRGGYPPSNSRRTAVKGLILVGMPDYRGDDSILSKLKVLASFPIQLAWILRRMARASVVHTRGPSVPALIVVLLAFLYRKPVYWYKYAGNWSERSSPLAFRLQRMLLRVRRKKRFRVTVNGAWPGLSSAFLNWHNPCVTGEEMQMACKSKRDYSASWRFCFVGSLDPFKGALRLVHALMASKNLTGKIESVWIVGDGPERALLEDLQGMTGFPLHVTGFLARPEIFKRVYTSSHFLVLPSESEGFPKVVAEASAHRCIPICTRVSAIDQYIQHGVNGFLLEDPDEQTMQKFFTSLSAFPADWLSAIADQAAANASEFTYERYRERIAAELLPLLGTW